MSRANKRVIRNDIIVILTFLAIALVLFAFIKSPSNSGSVAVVELDGKEIGRYPLSSEISLPIKNHEGDILLVLQIKGNEAFVSNSVCKDHSCERMGMISKKGESIICLPSRIIIKIMGDSCAEQGVLPDAVAFLDAEVKKRA